MKKNKTVINSIINLLMQVFPILAAIIFVPINIDIMGKELFGIYTLTITIIILFNYLNFGVAPATTKEIAKYLASGNFEVVKAIIYDSMLIMGVIGLLLGVVFYFGADRIAHLILSSEAEIKILEVLLSLMAILSPVLMLFLSCRAILEAKQMFWLTASVRALLNSIIFIAPVAMVLEKINIYHVMMIVIFTYFVFLCFFLFVIYRSFFRNNCSVVKFGGASRLLLTSGFWMMLISSAGIFLYYADRFLISALISIVAVAYYVAAYDLITRLSIISGSLTTALFPAFSEWHTLGEYNSINRAVHFVSKVIILMLLPIVFAFIVFSKEFLLLWINSDFSEGSAVILQILSVGVFFNSLSIVPNRTLIAIGKARFVAIFFVTSMVVFLLVLYFFIIHFGILGAGLAYTIRSFVECVFLYFSLSLSSTGLNFKMSQSFVIKSLSMVSLVIVVAFSLTFVDEIITKSFLAVINGIIFAVCAFLLLFDVHEKKQSACFMRKLYKRFS